ncbi:MAG: hypothetical protein Kow0083_04440 [Methylophaga sp.]|jgi:TusA-related sulfurtransferase
MSVLIGLLDLTMYGCPVHYIKAREATANIAFDEELDLLVNQGDAVTEVLKSLRRDGQQCEVLSEDELTATIRVRRKQ